LRKTLNIFKFTVIRVLFATLILVSIKTYGYTDTLSVGVYQNNPKVFIDNDGVAKGIFVDIIEEIAKRENWHIKYVYGSWIDNIERLKEGKIDILLDVSYSESRAKQFLFNNIFVIDTWLEVYMLSGSTINSITDLSGKRIAVIEGSVQHEYLVNEFNDVWDISFTLQVYPDYKSSTQALLLGQSDVMLTSRFFYFSENKHKDIVPVPIILRPSQIYFAFPKNQNLEIVNAIDKRLVQLKNNPKSVYYKSLNKWLKHYDTKNLLYRYKILGLTFIALITLLFSFIVTLRNQVRLKTKELRRRNKQLNEANKQLKLLVEKYKAIEEDLLQFQFMVENARQEAYLINPDGTIEYFNKSVENNLGYSLKELYGKNLNVLDPVYGKKFHQHFLELKKGELPAFETAHIDTRGKKHSKLIKSFYLQIGSKEFVCGFAEDITDQKKSALKLKQSEQLFQKLANMSPVGIFRTQADGLTTYVNPKWCELSGLQPNEALDNGWLKAVHPDDVKRISVQWTEHSGNSKNSEAEYRFLRPDGTIVWVLGNAIPEIINGETVGYVGTITDITDIKIAENSLKHRASEVDAQFKKYKELIELATDAFFHGDSKGNLILVNQAACKLTGYSEDELLTLNITNLFNDDEINRVPLRYDLLKKGLTVKNERVIVKKDKTTAIVEMNSRQMPDGTYQSFLRDITERKNTERLIKQQNEEIEAQNEEYKQLNIELLEAKAKAEESDRLKSAFLANMSHEIRTPMNAICGFSKLLERDNIDESKRKDYVDIINTNSQELLSIINDIIDISKIESGLTKVHANIFCLNSLIENIYKTHLNTATSKGIELLMRKGLPNSRSTIESDEQKVKQILNNLIVNALKYTHKGKIEIGYAIKKNSIEFIVSDTGIGISSKDHKLIFDRFQQVEDATSDSRRGTGLGLPISKAFAELLGGKMWLESEFGKGSTFYFTIPYAPVEKPLEEDDNNTVVLPNWPNKTILIVEDDKSNLQFLNEILSSSNAKLLTAVDGEDALNIFGKTPNIDLILMDIKLPKINGIDVTKAIRRKNKTIPIIAQTAYAFESDREAALNAGCNAFLSKPIEKDLLIETINRIFSKG